jgi:methionine-rich copper-binding protein CopC
MHQPRNSAASLVAAVALALLAAGTAAAHAYLKTSTPARGAVVTTLLREVRLVFTEPGEVRHSVFRVHRLEAPPGTERAQLNRMATSLARDVLRRPRADKPGRVDNGLATTQRRTTEIAIQLKPDLRPGHYVVIWHVLSVDGHRTQGSFLFTYRPAR